MVEEHKISPVLPLSYIYLHGIKNLLIHFGEDTLRYDHILRRPLETNHSPSEKSESDLVNQKLSCEVENKEKLITTESTPKSCLDITSTPIDLFCDVKILSIKEVG